MSEKHDKAMTIIEREERGLMSPVVSAGLKILEHNPNPETLRELIAMQREWEANEARKAYAMALVGLKVGLPTIIAHDKLVNFNQTRYTHTSLGAAVEAVTPHLINHGFTHSWYPAVNGGEVSVTCRLTHQAGHFEEVTLKAPPDNKGAKSGAQAVASTVTMLERYTLLALLGIATADQSEPEGGNEEPAPGKVDSGRNLKAVGWLKSIGVSAEEAEQYLSRKVPDWTASDLAKLKTWAKSNGTQA
jgi:hypothetical protein